MPRWKLTIEFDGTHFSGWQRQKKGRTVQEELESALSTFYREEIKVSGQGRTDSGVHAEGQVAHADLPGDMDPPRLLSALRGLLPGDMAVIDAVIEADDFHARFDAQSRLYRYQIATRPVPLKRHLHWLLLTPFEEDSLHRCAKIIRGKHDFRNFAKEEKPTGYVNSTECTITASHWEREQDIWIYKIEGNRFLRHMVRRIVGSTIMTATGRMEMDAFRELLDGKQVRRKGHSAPPEGLILEKVIYE
jgi:tRNA pseudouridine38-40 synthase